MNELNYMRQSLAEMYDRLEKLVQKYGESHSGDDLYRELSNLVHSVDAPNDALSNGGKNYYCKDGKWHGEWRGDA
jgi:hypothetical protein